MSARFPYYVLSDSEEGRLKESELTGIPPSDGPIGNDIKKGFVYQRVPHITLKSIANNPDIKEGMTREEIDEAIRLHADQELLYDQPYEDKKRVRVTGRFTVESLSPHRVLDPGEERPSTEVAAETDPQAESFVPTVLANLRKAGVQNTKRGERLTFDTLEPFAGAWIQASGEFTDKEGKKLSKSKKNYSDPLELMESSGADAVRWALYTGTVPGQSTRFFDRAASDAIREFLLKIWNVYSFFVTYANIEKWDANAPRVPVRERPALDRYVLAELDHTVRKVRAELDVYKSHQAVKHIEAFVDALSNWYVRRSRGRFWSNEESADKAAAFATLYEVLVDLTKLVAPFVPFVAESLYQNLVRSVDPAAPESVHLADYPRPDDARADELLRESVEEVRRAVTLGQRVRNEQKLKVRQPLAEAVIVVASDAERDRIAPFVAEIRDELNVEKVSFTSDPSRYVEFTLLPNFRALGPKLGKLVPACKKALMDADGAALYAEMSERGQVTIQVEGQEITLTGEEIEVRLSAKEDFAAASQGGHVVVLDTRLTPELVRAGLAREALSRIQRARKERDLPFDARIAITYEASGDLGAALAEHAAYIAEESLAVRFEAGSPGEGAVEEKVEGERFAFTIDVVG